MKTITISKEFFDKLLESLESMTDYADDGQVSRYDPDFKDFYDAVDEAREVINEGYKILEEEPVDNTKPWEKY